LLRAILSTVEGWRAPPLIETCSFNQDTDIAGFNSCA
jgi:hypothetical protein